MAANVDDVDVVGEAAEAAAERRAEIAEEEIDENFIGCDPRTIRELRAAPPELVILPNSYVPVEFAAQRIFPLLAKQLFVRGGRIMRLSPERDGLTIVTPNEFRALLSKRRRVKHFFGGQNSRELALKFTECSKDTAELLLASDTAKTLLPRVAVLRRTACIVPHEEKLLILGTGYHDVAGGVLVLEGGAPPDVPVAVAVAAILETLGDFCFSTPSDKSRAVASIIGLTLRMGGFLKGHAPIDVTQADEPGAGKGYRAALIAAMHGEEPYFIVKKKGGVGSLDESVAAWLESGRPIGVLDNVRGRVDSEYIEMLTTANGPVPVRVPHKGEMRVSAKSSQLQLTSNHASSTRDLAERMIIVSIKHQPPEYLFAQYPEGGIKEHIEANQPFYAACIFAVVRGWWDAGQPTLQTAHRFREWVGALDWIVQNIFKLPPMIDTEHQSVVANVQNPARSWLRAIALVAVKQIECQWVSATKLATVSIGADIEIPGVRPGTAADQAARIIGGLLASCFEQNDKVEIEGITVERCKAEEYDEKQQKNRTVIRYRFDAGRGEM